MVNLKMFPNNSATLSRNRVDPSSDGFILSETVCPDFFGQRPGGNVALSLFVSRLNTNTELNEAARSEPQSKVLKAETLQGHCGFLQIFTVVSLSLKLLV